MTGANSPDVEKAAAVQRLVDQAVEQGHGEHVADPAVLSTVAAITTRGPHARAS